MVLQTMLLCQLLTLITFYLIYSKLLERCRTTTRPAFLKILKKLQNSKPPNHNLSPTPYETVLKIPAPSVY